MGHHQKTLTVSPAAWCDEAARILAGSILRAPCFGVDDYRRAYEAGAKLFEVRAGAELVGFVLLDIERTAHGAEGVILAAAGRLDGVDLTAELLPVLESYFLGVQAIRITSARPAFIRRLRQFGYQASHMVFRKKVNHAPA